MLVTVFAPAKVHLLEIAGLRDAFFEANCKISSGHAYRVRLVTETGLPEDSASGVKYVPDASIREATERSDTLIVAGPYGVPVRLSEEATQWLREQAQHSRRYGSTCTGAFLLARAGLLAGHRATTHWQYAERLAAEFPDIRVEPDRIFVRDGSVFSSAGVTAAIDLAFSLIEEDHGRALALWVARRLVVFLKRPVVSPSSARRSRRRALPPAPSTGYGCMSSRIRAPIWVLTRWPRWPASVRATCPGCFARRRA